MPVSPDDLEGRMTLAEAAETLGYSYRHMRRLIASGEIEHIRRGKRGRIMITRRALTDYLNRQNNRASA